MALLRVWCVVAAAAFATSPAWAWREGVEYSQQIEHCEGLPLGSADSLAIRVLPQDGSFGAPRLAGMKEGQVLWEQPLPEPEEVNAAKLFAYCEGNLIKIRHEYPGTSGGKAATYEWDGHSARLAASGLSDPTSDAITETEKGILSGTITDPSVIDQRILYPQNFDWAGMILNAIQSADAAGHQLAKSQDYATAATRMSLMFDLTRRYSWLRGANVRPETTYAASPTEWTEAWEAVGLPVGSFVAELNNYGYFLQAARQDEKAIAVFEEVKRLAPNRAANYLNLADSLWAIGRRDEARQAYATYRDLMAGASVPDRVNDRAK